MTSQFLQCDESPQEFHIKLPDNIQSDISTRWFHLYEWISPSEFMITIQRDYLSIMDRYLFPMAIFSSIFATIGMVIGGTSGAFGWLLLSIVCVYPIIFLVLIVKSLQRSFLFNHVANVVFTDKVLIFGQEIVSLDVIRSHKDIANWEREFDEDFLGESHLAKKKIIFFDSLLLKIKQIFEKLSRTGDLDARIVPIAYLLGAVFSLAIVVMYGIGVGFAWLLGLVFSLVNRLILNVRNNLLYRINRAFLNLWESSNALQDMSQSLIVHLSNAQTNKWSDNLSGNIADSIIDVNTYANMSVQKTLLLRRLLESSSYSKIFNFPLFESWIRDRVLQPINEIIILLENNQEILQKMISEANVTAQNIDSNTGKNAIQLANDRLALQLENIDKQLNILQWYRDKLQI